MSTRRSVVKWFDAKKGYGFIVHPEGASDIFVHYSAIDTERRFKTLRTGQVVEFELSDGPKGLHAINVVPADVVDQLPLDSDPSDELSEAAHHDVSESAFGDDPAFGGDSASAGSVRAGA